eukprot:CAMPEP_0198734092 /NCGR_PEP_ID=MMETSP1475-20131203/50344_1 /TAXON_ID= ORGANISM="Unidentified sp., Strain CCMP1999" /NCGR_SAMPLE_ID=MMETSP1475 /ASSEMBLY_ACC=CAM_ASM_001111 /LENGTH=359 /DNA_ID=CAMNT_0044497499 /DNA_START=97 /DNA_END=1176 /DNA_ORIENTATION=-
MAFVSGTVPGAWTKRSTAVRQRRAGARVGVRMTLTAEKMSKLEDLKNDLRKSLAPQLLDENEPVDTSIYTDDVLFLDPLNNFRGAKKQANNIQMLKKSPIMTSVGFDLHSIWIDEKKEAVMTRWTLKLKFMLLPWQPILRFTGTSEYGLNDELLVERHIDKWDSINNNTPLSLEAVRDLIKEMTRAEAFQPTGSIVPWKLIRRDVRGFEIRKLEPVTMASCSYTHRGEGIARLDSYFDGANEEMGRVPRSKPLLLKFPSGLSDTDSKMMLSAIDMEKAPRSNTPQVKLENFPRMTFAAMSFKDPIVPSVAAQQEKKLQNIISQDGYNRKSSEVIFAQYNAVFSLPWMRWNEVWIPLDNE